MSASVGAESGGKSQDFDLNLAPIIDCFTVLIAFMLASASYLAIGVFESAVANNAAAPNTNQPPASIRIDVDLTMEKEIVLKVDGKLKLQKKIPAVNGAYDLGSLVTEITSLRGKFSDAKNMVLSAADDVEYNEIIAAMETLKKAMPSILLGGL